MRQSEVQHRSASSSRQRPGEPRWRLALGALFGVFLLTFAPAIARADASAASPAPGLALRIEASGWLASLSGSLQTPRGGAAGSSSRGRPELSEIGLGGLEVLATIDAGITIRGDHELHIDFVHIDQRGGATLRSDLVSQGQAFPAGARVAARLRLPMLRVGYRAHALALSWRGWTAVPELGFGIVPFRYQLESPTVTGRVDRAYSVGFPYLGLELSGPLGGSSTLEFELSGMGGVNGVSTVDQELRLVHPLFRSGAAEISGLVGLRGTWFRRRDSQRPERNDIDLRIGSFSRDPWAGLSLGIRARF